MDEITIKLYAALRDLYQEAEEGSPHLSSTMKQALKAMEDYRAAYLKRLGAEK